MKDVLFKKFRSMFYENIFCKTTDKKIIYFVFTATTIKQNQSYMIKFLACNILFS